MSFTVDFLRDEGFGICSETAFFMQFTLRQTSRGGGGVVEEGL